MPFVADPDRYSKLPYRRCGRSGLDLPAISLGLWQNFGGVDVFDTGRAILRRAFDRGVTHFDLANNYGPRPAPPRRISAACWRTDFAAYRDELVISTKAGYGMWPGPYGEWGSRKYLLASLDQSLKRMGLDYVDIFYSHRLDPDTPLEETMGALDTRRAPGQGALCRHLVVLAREDAQGGRDPEASSARPASSTSPPIRCSTAGSRTRLARRARGTRHRLHRLLAARAGHAHDEYLNGIPEGSRATRGGSLRERFLDARQRLARIARPEQHRPAAGPVPGSDGDRLGAARPAHHVSAHRRAQCQPTGRLALGSRSARFLARGTRRNRPSCRRSRHQPVAAILDRGGARLRPHGTEAGPALVRLRSRSRVPRERRFLLRASWRNQCPASSS